MLPGTSEPYVNRTKKPVASPISNAHGSPNYLGPPSRVSKSLPRAPHLVLLGDIGNITPHKTDLVAFLTQQLLQFHTVLFVPGNHEAYSSEWLAALAILRVFEEEVRSHTALGEFILLDRAVFRLPEEGVTILGCSLFSSIPPESKMAIGKGLNDFSQIKHWDVSAHNAAHRRDVAWLNARVADLEQSNTMIIILTHWGPSVDARSIDPKQSARLPSAYSTDLSDQRCFKSSNVKLWAFGHMHYNCDFQAERSENAGSLRLLANQRGYDFAQAEGYNGEKTVEV